MEVVCGLMHPPLRWGPEWWVEEVSAACGVSSPLRPAGAQPSLLCLSYLHPSPPKPDSLLSLLLWWLVVIPVSSPIDFCIVGLFNNDPDL